MKDDQGWWYFFFSVFFTVVFIALMYVLRQLGRLPTEIGVFDFSLLILATFRLTRLFVYDKVTQFIRDWFLHKDILEDKERGEYIIVRHTLSSGPRRVISELLSCPWCFGLWAATITGFFYFLTPLAWFPILILALAGVGTFLQLLSNMIGWRAQRLKQKVEND